MLHRSSSRGSYDGGKIAGLYDLEETLGRGHFAVVKLARHVFTGEKVAVKVIDKTKLDEVSRSHLFQEVRCMKLVQHPNVVRLYEVIDTHSKLYLILELADGGDLYDYIMRHESGLSESLAQEYFSQIVRAISYCHKLHVVHRDLKPENVVFFERIGVVKLTDFGFSNKFCPGQKLETSCGSLAYSAPEILLGDSYDAPAVDSIDHVCVVLEEKDEKFRVATKDGYLVDGSNEIVLLEPDIWSLGVILYMLVCGQAPFQEANDSETLTMIMDCKYTTPDHISHDCKRLIARMLVRQPDKRATLEEITTDVWLKSSQFDIPAVPLISRQNISDEDHSLIVQKMVNGDIATKEQILEALDKNAYNHITATYYLLAERKLRSLEPKNKCISSQPVPRVSVDSCVDDNESCSTFRTNPHTLLPILDVAQRIRKCSIVAEEEDEEEKEENGEASLHSSQNRRGSRSEGKLNLTVHELRKDSVAGCSVNECGGVGSSVCSASSVQRVSKLLPAPLISARSSPQLGLEEISEDGVTVRSSSSTARNFHTFEQRRSRFRKSRTTSCSSSEASDEDSENRKKHDSSKSLRGHRGDPKDPNGGSGAAGGECSQPPEDSSFADAEQKRSSSSERSNSSDINDRFRSSGVNGRKHYLSERRKRKAEIRLRESKSLNRITEVQESEVLPSSDIFQSNVGKTGDSRKMNGNESGVLNRLIARTDRLKRNPIINKCFTLQRKLCMPLLKRGRLYKTQSCTEVRNAKDVNQNIKSTT